MPTGIKGSLTHSASAYRRGACREACCREHHRVDAANKRADGRMGMNSGLEIVVRDGTTALLTKRQAAVLVAWLKDGADPETVGRRIGIGRGRVTHTLGLIQKAYGFTNRAEMALAFARRAVDFVVVPSRSRRRDVTA